MRRWSAILVSVVLGSLSIGCGPSRFHNVQLRAPIDLAPASVRIGEPLAVVVLERVKEDVTLTKFNGDVVIHIANFRGELTQALSKALRPQFTEIPFRETTGRGLELVMVDVVPSPHNDALSFHAVLRDGGRDVYEFKDSVTPPPKLVGASAFTWQTAVKELTVQNLEAGLAALAERIRDRLLISNDLRDFWRGRNQQVGGAAVRSF